MTLFITAQKGWAEKVWVRICLSKIYKYQNILHKYDQIILRQYKMKTRIPRMELMPTAFWKLLNKEL